MSIDKWLNPDKEGDSNKKDQFDKKLHEQQLKELKIKKLQQLKREIKEKKASRSGSDDFLSYFLEFKDWLNKRTYLKGDLDEIATWINNLYNKLNLQVPHNNDNDDGEDRFLLDLKKQYKKIPLSFLDDKTRIMINKIIYDQNRSNSDNYFIKKLNLKIQDKLKEAEYYQILKKILELK